MTPQRSRLVLSGAMTALGVALLAAALLPRSAGGAPATGGTFRYGSTFIDAIDPAKAFQYDTWAAVALTCSRLMSFPDRPLPHGLRLVPQAAEGYPRVSRDGRTYRFTVRRGLRFSNGDPVRAANFAYAINRVLSPTMRSPAAESYLGDVVGARDVTEGRTDRAAGVTARGRTLMIRLTKPVGDLPARLAAPFFCPVPVGLPPDPEGLGAQVPGSGPYYVSEYRPQRRVVLVRNRYYRGSRARNVDRFVFSADMDLARTVARVERGELDAVEVQGTPQLLTLRQELARRYGINRGRFHARPAPGIFYLPLNNERPLFRNNPRLRKAVNFALDRRALTRVHGPTAANATDQFLPPGFPGFRNARLYPLRRPNLARARALARGHLRHRKAVFYASPSGFPFDIAQIVRSNLGAIGLEVEIRYFPPRVRHTRMATRGEPFDIGVAAWFPDWADPYQFMNILLDGRSIAPRDGTNYSYFNSTRYNRRLAAAARLQGRARYRAYGEVDVDVMREAAPAVPYATPTAFTLVSARVGCRVFNPTLDLDAVCLN